MNGEGGTAALSWRDLLQAVAWLATACGAVLAAWQLRRQARQARANFLLELFRQWEALTRERGVLHQLRGHCVQEVLRQHAPLSDPERQVKLRQLAETELERMEGDPARLDDYQALLRMLGFFEHVGLMVRRGYVSFEDVDGLLRDPIVVVDMLCRGHVEELQRRSNVTPGLYEHFLHLADRTADGLD